MTITSSDAVAPSQSDVLAVVIIGAGFAGIGMAIALRKAGIHDVVVLEKQSDLGGVWRDSTYPGAACDVPSHLYSFSFALNPDWSRVFSDRAEIHAYLARCAADHGVMQSIRFDVTVSGAEWDEARGVWRVALAEGVRLEARLLVSAVGLLGRAALPNLPGLDQIAVPAFHSSCWRHDVDLAGKRIAVIGTGASAVQFVPSVAAQAERLTVFQRSPPWIMPRLDRSYCDREKARFARHPWLMRLHRLRIYAQYESRAVAFTRMRSAMKLAVGRPFRKMLTKQVPDPGLRGKLVPAYPIGCKRILLSSDYLVALAQPNVEVVTEPITKLTANGVETADGRLREVDVVIYGTGFAATEYLAPMRIAGREGCELNKVWQGGASAYLGLAVPSFPNFFILYGPNTNLGHNSIIYMLESQIEHVMRCLRQMRDSGASMVEIRADAHTRQDAQVQQRLTKSVWAGCRSWYVDASSRNSVNWPGFSLSYRWLTRHSSLSIYDFVNLPSSSAATTPANG